MLLALPLLLICLRMLVAVWRGSENHTNIEESSALNGAHDDDRIFV